MPRERTDIGDQPGSARLAMAGLAAVLVLMAVFSIGSGLVTRSRAADVASAAAIDEAYHEARLAVATEESLERKYRLEPSPEVLARYDAAAADLIAALEQVQRLDQGSAGRLAKDTVARHTIYLGAIRRMFARIDSGDIVGATAIDSEQVDPTFSAVDEFVLKGSSVQEAAARRAVDRLRHTEAVAVWATPVVFVIGFALLGTFALTLRRHRRRFDHQALHDALTGLPNRTLLREQAIQALAIGARTGTSTALLFVDLDRFKEINDALGHQRGDDLLVQVGPRLGSALRDSDSIARLGGDEFAVLLTNLTGVDMATGVADKIRSVLAEPFQVGSLSLPIEASIGVAVAPELAADADELMQRADVAMYVAKSGRTGIALYDPAADRSSPSRLALLGELRHAIEQDQLVLFYQPKVQVPGGAVLGVEALVRWRHPERGLLPPSEFVELAEHTALIGPLTSWVLRTAAAQVARWRQLGYSVPVAVNVSARSLTDLGFVTELEQVLAEAAVPARLLEIEVTETAMMSDPDRTRQVLNLIAALGVSIAVDDFGTGYTSLAYLQTLPITTLKIDRSFVGTMCSNDADAVIVRSLVELGRNLGLGVVAEGVEDVETCTALARAGCPSGQGYFWSRPLPADELEATVLAERTMPLRLD